MTGKKIKVGTPTTIHGVLEFESGAIITIGASWDTFSHGHHNIELYGTEGSVYVPDPNFFGGDIMVSDQSGAKHRVEPWDHPFGKANQGLDTATPRANYRTAGLADMIQSIEKGRAGPLRARRRAARGRRHDLAAQGRRDRQGHHALDHLRPPGAARSPRMRWRC